MRHFARHLMTVTAAGVLAGVLTLTPCPLHAQFSQTVTEQVTPPAGSNAQLSVPLSNIGQSTHYFTVASRNSSGAGIPATPTLIQQTSTMNCIWSSGPSYTCPLGSTPAPADVLVFTGGSNTSSGAVFSSPGSTNAQWNQIARIATTGSPTTVTLTTGTTWLAPANVTSIQVECVGGGGGGSFLSSGNVGGGGGGGGAYARRNAMPVTSGNTYTYAIGSGGVGSSAATGGTTTFTGDSSQQCAGIGGVGGTATGGGTGGSAASSTGDVVFSGGMGASGAASAGGGGGGSAGNASVGTAATTSTGAAAVAGGGPGGNGATGSGGAGFAPATTPGGGGGGSLAATGSPTTVTLTSGTTWTAPAGVTSIQVECVGGGGGGGNSNSGGGGGGGAAYARRNSITVTPGMMYTYTIGSGGASVGNNATNGGTTTFTGNSGVQCSAAGGSGASVGNGGSGGSAAASTGDITFNGGNGATASANMYSGGGGGSGGGSSAGTAAVNYHGSSAVTGGGPGGDGSIFMSVSAIGSAPIVGPGGGGGGAIATSSGGGNGFNGQIRITYTTGGTTFNGGNGANGIITITYTPTTSESAIWCANLSGTPGGTVTITLANGTPASAGGNVSEWSGTTCANDSFSSGGTGTSAVPAVPAITTVNGTDLLLATAFRAAASGSLSSGPTNSYTALNTAAVNSAQAYRVVSSTGTYSTAWTYSTSTAWSAVTASLRAFTGGVCGGQFSAQLVGSYNSPGTVLPNLVLPTQEIAVQSSGSVGNNLIRTYQATGAYPALNIYLPIYDPANCVYDMFYSGVVGGSVGQAITNDNNLTPQTFSSSSMGDTTLVTAASQYYITVYGAQICNKTAAQTVILQSATTGTSGLVKYATFPNMAAGQCVVVPTSQLPVWSARASAVPSTQTSALVLNLSAATEVDVQLWYQFE